MCGIVGVIKDASIPAVDENKLEEVFKSLLFIDQLRGEDATGIYGIRHHLTATNVACHYVKRAMAAQDFLQLNKVEDQIFRKWYQLKAVVGHNRFATMNRTEVNDAHAHPFEHKHIILVHNGTLTNHEVFNTDKITFDIDSQALTHSIAENGLQYTLDNIRGAYSLVYSDLEQRNINFIRNRERPMYLGILENIKGIVFASEKDMLWWALQRHGVKLRSIVEPQPHQLVTINPTSDPVCKVTQLTVKTPPFTSYANINDYYSGGTTGRHQGHITHSEYWDRAREDQEKKRRQREQKDDTTSNKRSKPEKKASNKLAKLGLEYGQWLNVYYCGYKEYPQNQSRNVTQRITGQVLGCTIAEPYYDVMIPKVPKDKMRMYESQTNKNNEMGLVGFKGKAINIHHPPKTKNKSKYDPEFYIILDWETCFPIFEMEDFDDDVTTQEDLYEEYLRDKEKQRDKELKDNLFYGPNKLTLSRTEFVYAVDNGCAMCGDVVEPEDHLIIGWTERPEEPICQTCCRNPETHEYMQYPPIHKDS